jgi:hypothetical protein
VKDTDKRRLEADFFLAPINGMGSSGKMDRSRREKCEEDVGVHRVQGFVVRHGTFKVFREQQGVKNSIP